MIIRNNLLLCVLQERERDKQKRAQEIEEIEREGKAQVIERET